MGETSTGYTKKNKTRKGRKSWLWITLVMLFITMSCAFISYNYVTSGQKKAEEIVASISEGSQIRFEVPYGSGSSDIAKKLQAEGIIKYPSVFRIASKINGYDGSYKSGVHILSKDLSYEDIMIILTDEPVGNGQGK